MTLTDRLVFFRLTREGRAALHGVVPGSFEARVVAQDEHGAWINWLSIEERATVEPSRPIPVLLLKWQYFVSAEFIQLPEAKTQV